MARGETPIRRTLMTMVLVTCGAVVLVMTAGSYFYELLTYRQSTTRNLSTIGQMIATNSTAALAFNNPDDAREVLAALKVERHIVAAGLYGSDGALFATYPAGLLPAALPAALGAPGYRQQNGHLIGFEPVVQGGRRLGTLYLDSDLNALYEHLWLFSAMAALVVGISFLVAYVISRRLQHRISQPILALAETAKAVSSRQDYSVRAIRPAGEELGLLTDALNHMLTRIAEQHSALAESEGRVRAVLNSALSAVVVIDAQGRVADWNPRAEGMFGWSAAEASGRQLDELIIPPRFHAAHRAGLARYLATRAGTILNRLVELSALRRDGSEFPVELSISPLTTGATVTFCGFVTDITSRKEAEQRVQAQLSRLALLHDITRAIGDRQDLPSIFQVVLRRLEDQLPVDFACLCRYNPESKSLIIASIGAGSAPLAARLALAERMVLPIDPDGLAQCVAGQLVYEPDTGRVPFAFAQRLAAGGLQSLVVAPLLVESQVFGILVAARSAAQAFQSADCEFLRQLSEHVGLASHSVQLYGALQQAYDDLRQTQHTVMQQERLRALGQMASGIAHDINNAISPVALYTESLLEREPNLSERTRAYLTTIQQSIEDVAGTVARMREFYRPREAQLQLARVDLNRTVEQVVELTRARWSDLPQQRGVFIELKTELLPALPAIMGAEGEIRDALTNLIFNAVDAMPDGGTLTLRSRLVPGATVADPHGPNSVYVEVADTGIGMDEETRRRCLEPFFTTKGERGTGLGLAMVYGMVQRHSADFEITSAPGRGTAVRLIFATAETELATTPVPATDEAPSRRLRILLVDDDPMLIKSLRDILDGDGHTVTATDGGQSGIDAFNSALAAGKPHEVVITDLGMPYVDGRRVAAAIKTASPATPVIMLTGWGKRLLAENDVPAHVDRVISKPPRLAEIRRALAELVTKVAGPA
jgi:PAS domain S-box-containing protein